ncbi:hypothetical protein M011DRAFT_320951 [Sporormia fimetaria CBS 119925]|uniref:Uncharacterized protein n=1 Tax=Sporormia fimetaria CBS 119925 TaxID=1340428 RepID=A0A6A6VEI4_9PLEO|nr:hypothetical protein M011DRAFT_320951 [Sporormia fimetaria CBS 119925]
MGAAPTPAPVGRCNLNREIRAEAYSVLPMLDSRTSESHSVFSFDYAMSSRMLAARGRLLHRFPLFSDLSIPPLLPEVVLSPRSLKCTGRKSPGCRGQVHDYRQVGCKAHWVECFPPLQPLSTQILLQMYGNTLTKCTTRTPPSICKKVPVYPMWERNKQQRSPLVCISWYSTASSTRGHLPTLPMDMEDSMKSRRFGQR